MNALICQNHGLALLSRFGTNWKDVQYMYRLIDDSGTPVAAYIQNHTFACMSCKSDVWNAAPTTVFPFIARDLITAPLD